MSTLHKILTGAWVVVAMMCGALAAAKGAAESGAQGIATVQDAIQALKEAEIICEGKQKESRIGAQFLLEGDKKAQEVSKDLLKHVAAYQSESETLTDYPYIETIIQLFKYRLDKKKKFPVGALEPFYAAGCRPKGIPPQIQACYRPQPTKVIKALLKEGTSVHATDEDGENMLHAAARCKLGANILQTLIKAGVSINAPNKYGYTPLHLATQACADKKSLLTLLKAGADPKAQTKAEHLTPVMVGMESCTLKSITAMMEAGLDLNARNSANNTALLLLGQQNISPEELAVFLKSGCNLNERAGTARWTPALALLMKADEKLLRALAAAKADFTVVDGYGRSALHYIILNKKVTPAMLGFMLKEQKNVNIADKLNQNTPLHLAVSCKRSAEIVKMLLDAGANKNLKNRENETASDIARKQKNEQLIKLLSERQ